MNDATLEKDLAAWRTDALDTILHKVAKIETLHTKVDGLIDIQKRQDLTLEKLTDAVSRLAVIEDRQNSDRGALERAFGAIKDVSLAQQATAEKLTELLSDIEGRVDALETAETHNARVRNTLYAAAGVILLGVLYMVMSSIGLRTP